jgi:hypothetical protein
MASMLSVAMAKICELETRLNNWNILLQRERNRTSALEKAATVKKTSPTRVSLNSCGGEQAEVVDALAGCVDGASKTLTLAECQVPMMTEDGIMGVELGPTWLPAKVTLRSGSFANTTYTYSLAAHNPPKCAKWALIAGSLSIRSSTGLGTNASQVFSVNGANVEMEEMRVTLDPGGYDTDTRILRVPIVNGEVKFRTVVGATHTNRSFLLNLAGFE